MPATVRIAALFVLTTLGSLAAAAEDTPVPPAAPAAPPTAVPASDGPAKGEMPATVLDGQEVEGLLGKEVRTSTGENLGRIIDLIVNRSGQVRAAIIDFGGFLGVGSRKIAVDWRALRFPPAGKLDRLVLDLTRNEVRLAPEYKPGEQVVVLGPSAAAQQARPAAPAAAEK